MSSAHFASGTNFWTPNKTPRKDFERSQMSLSELDDNKGTQFQRETDEFLGRVQAVKGDLNVLMMKTSGYTRNTATSYKESLTPKGERDSGYERSPFGKRLHISDYSSAITPTSLKGRRSRA